MNQEPIISPRLLKHLNYATFEALRMMNEGRVPKLTAPVPDLYYPNGCPVLSEGPQKDDL